MSYKKQRFLPSALPSLIPMSTMAMAPGSYLKMILLSSISVFALAIPKKKIAM